MSTVILNMTSPNFATVCMIKVEKFARHPIRNDVTNQVWMICDIRVQ